MKRFAIELVFGASYGVEDCSARELGNKPSSLARCVFVLYLISDHFVQLLATEDSLPDVFEEGWFIGGHGAVARWALFAWSGGLGIGIRRADLFSGNQKAVA